MKQVAKQQSVICILGGMGPQASARLLTRMVDLCTIAGAKEGRDFPEIIVDSVPVIDFISDTKNKEKALEMLRQRIEKLNAFSPTCFGIACNTAHIFLEELRLVADASFVSVIDEVALAVRRNRLKKVGLLATPTTIRSKLYQRELGELGIEIVMPNVEDLIGLERIIRKILAGKNRSTDLKILIAIAEKLHARDAQGVILGCTELPLIFPREFSVPVFSSIDILANALLHKVR